MTNEGIIPYATVSNEESLQEEWRKATAQRNILLAGELEEMESGRSPQDYANRKGYDPNFLGSDEAHRVPLPRLSPQMEEDAVPVNSGTSRSAGRKNYVLHYLHFSLVMSAKRKLAYYTACNIDGNRSRRIKRKEDRWILDPRIGREHQTFGAVYGSPNLDRGHLVRRLDPGWGTVALATKACDDTFHYTNAAPQVAAYNRGIWNELEDYILTNADNRDLKVHIFTGAVLRDGDPEFELVQLPTEFWKVAVMVKESGDLSATAYMISQAHLLTSLEAGFVFGTFQTNQVSITWIESLTGLDFGKLRDSDPLGGTVEAFGGTAIRTPEDLTL